MTAADFDVILFDSIGVTLLQSPRYLQDETVDKVDAAGRVVLDEPRFWQRAADRLGLDDMGVASLQSRIAAKYCRNLNVWAQLRGLAEGRRLVLAHPGPAALLPHWRSAYALDDIFARLFAAAELATPPSEPAFYQRVADDLGCPRRRMLVVDDEAEPILAAKDAGCPTYRYGSAYGLMRMISDER
jgi:hypothetical protein